MSKEGDICKCCKAERARLEVPPRRLIEANGVIVCRFCDAVDEWPSQRKKRRAA